MSQGFEIVESAKTIFLSRTWRNKNNLSFSNMAEHSQSRGNFNRCDGRFLLNEHGDLYNFYYIKILYIFP